MKAWIVYNPRDTFDSEEDAKNFINYMEKVSAHLCDLVILEVDMSVEVKLMWGDEPYTK